MSQPDELPDGVAQRVSEPDYLRGQAQRIARRNTAGTFTALNAAADRIERLEAQQAAALALHYQISDGSAERWCAECDAVYPCPTRRALTEDTP